MDRPSSTGERDAESRADRTTPDDARRRPLARFGSVVGMRVAVRMDLVAVSVVTRWQRVEI
ncbi:MAG: hypothetical protein OEV61_04480, partial [Chloroflexota bacterium]|nr:hypothetical protein [Chloroflexota bacterium]